MSYDINELRRKFNKGSVEEQISEYEKIFHELNPGIKSFSELPPVDQLSKEEEDYIREGLLEANKLRKEGKLK